MFAIVALLVAAAVTFLLLRRSRHKHAWLAQLDAAEGEVGWFARDLIPQLASSATAEEVAGGWAVAESRVATLADQLTALQATAPGDQERARSAALHDAVHTAQARVQTLVTTGSGGLAAGLNEAQQSLLAVLLPQPPGSDHPR